MHHPNIQCKKGEFFGPAPLLSFSQLVPWAAKLVALLHAVLDA